MSTTGILAIGVAPTFLDATTVVEDCATGVELRSVAGLVFDPTLTIRGSTTGGSASHGRHLYTVHVRDPLVDISKVIQSDEILNVVGDAVADELRMLHVEAADDETWLELKTSWNGRHCYGEYLYTMITKTISAQQQFVVWSWRKVNENEQRSDPK